MMTDAAKIHSIEALEDSVVFEVSTPQLDDVVRLSDRYGRTDEDSRVFPAGADFRRDFGIAPDVSRISPFVVKVPTATGGF